MVANTDLTHRIEPVNNCSCQFPTGAVRAFDEGCGFGAVLGTHIWPVPLDFLADPQRDAAEEHDFREHRADFKTGETVRRFSSLDGGEPFQMMLEISAARVRIAEHRLRNGGKGRVFFVMGEFRFARQLDEKLSAAVKNKALPVILVCATGARANRAVAVAKKLGYEQAQALGGGLKAWKEANLPLEKA